jgi:polyhydroxyalkanoate synthesis regulator phasin
MSKTNTKLDSTIGTLQPKPALVASKAIPKPDTTNISGHSAYTQDKWRKLLTILNTSKLQSQYYRSESSTLKDLQLLINECAQENLYLTCQCIVYSRCVGEGLRTISHAAAVLISSHLAGSEFSKRFYSQWDRSKKQGGVIFRPDDMYEIMQGFIALNSSSESSPKLTNAMKKGFASAIESFDSYPLLKYKSSLIDVINLVRPKATNSEATVIIDGKMHYTINAIMQGLKVSADTWEVNQVKAGQIVADAVKEGKIDAVEAKSILTEAKAENWDELLQNDKLGILAAVRNIRNILLNNPKKSTVDALDKLLSNSDRIRDGRIFPYQLDMANELIMQEFPHNPDARRLQVALLKGYTHAVPNLAAILPGRNVIFLDQSGSMDYMIRYNGKNGSQSCSKKASMLAATIALATNADIIRFGSTAEYTAYSPSVDIFTLAGQIDNPKMGGTSLASAWDLASRKGVKYDRVFILSDNECNIGSSYERYKQYIEKVGDPYVYSVDLAGYGTDCMAGDKVKYFYGYGMAMFEDIAKLEYNPDHHMDKVKQIII